MDRKEQMALSPDKACYMDGLAFRAKAFFD
jgi:hypothetical protein